MELLKEIRLFFRLGLKSWFTRRRSLRDRPVQKKLLRDLEDPNFVAPPSRQKHWRVPGSLDDQRLRDWIDKNR